MRAARLTEMMTLPVAALASGLPPGARLSARYAGVEEKIRFIVRDATHLPWDAGTFDAAITTSAMHHIARLESVLEEMLRVVKPSGKIVLADSSPRGS